MSKAFRLVAATVLFGALLFVTAGTITWPAAWIYLAILTGSLTVYAVILVRLHPDLIDERARRHADAKRWDKPLVAIIGGIGPLAVLFLCGFDRRFHWTPPMPTWLVIVGLLLVAAGGALTNCAVACNRFFSAFVRIQRDRGHHVVDSGPYHVVRHPGYIASILHMFGTAFAFESSRALVVVVVLAAVVAVRTALEDRTLQAELEGYADYARRVHFRLVPGIW